MSAVSARRLLYCFYSCIFRRCLLCSRWTRNEFEGNAKTNANQNQNPIPKVFLALLFAFVVHLPLQCAKRRTIQILSRLRGLKEEQIAAIRNGKAIAKVVESRTPDEVFVFGSVYVRSTPEQYLKLASDIDALRKLPNYLAIRKFSDPPQLSDLDGFHSRGERHQATEKL